MTINIDVGCPPGDGFHQQVLGPTPHKDQSLVHRGLRLIFKNRGRSGSSSLFVIRI